MLHLTAHTANNQTVYSTTYLVSALPVNLSTGHPVKCRPMRNYKNFQGFKSVMPLSRILQRAFVSDRVSLIDSMDNGNRLPCQPAEFRGTPSNLLTGWPAPSLHSRKMTAESFSSRTCPSRNAPGSILLSLTSVAWVFDPCQTTETACAAQGPSFTNCQFPASEWMPNLKLDLSRCAVLRALKMLTTRAAVATATASHEASKFMYSILSGMR